MFVQDNVANFMDRHIRGGKFVRLFNGYFTPEGKKANWFFRNITEFAFF